MHMNMTHAENESAETRRREIFLALVECQDQGIPVARSRSLIAERFAVSVEQVLGIEREGLDNAWPPLGET
jgi:hypothetical protein